MGKTRVHELAKELDVQAKDIITYLTANNIEVTSHMSTIDEKAIQMVKNKFGKKAEAAPAKAEGGEGRQQQERPRKKSSISVRFACCNDRRKYWLLVAKCSTKCTS